MSSPFPGMDPYLEDEFFWPDFHFGMNAAMREYLNRHLPSDFVAVADRYVWIHEADAQERLRRSRPDVHVAERSVSVESAARSTTRTAPIQTVLPAMTREGNRYIRIMDRQQRRVVTVIELLSPSNKHPGPDRDAYLSKRNDFLASRANVIEIDLLREGERLPLGEPSPPIRDYYALVVKAVEFPRVGIWPFTVREPFPEIPIPLREGDDDIPLPLKTCFDHAYETGRYGSEIDYTKPLSSPPRLEDAKWCEQIAKSAATR